MPCSLQSYHEGFQVLHSLNVEGKRSKESWYPGSVVVRQRIGGNHAFIRLLCGILGSEPRLSYSWLCHILNVGNLKDDIQALSTHDTSSNEDR